MPYINIQDRAVLDPTIEQLHKALINLELDNETSIFDTNLEYVILKLLKLSYEGRLADITAAAGVLSTVQQAYIMDVVQPAFVQHRFDTGEVTGNESIHLGEVTVVSKAPKD